MPYVITPPFVGDGTGAVPYICRDNPLWLSEAFPDVPV